MVSFAIMSSKKHIWMVISILAILISGALLVHGNIVWQDTFDDSSSLENYEIVNGELRSDGVLTSLGCDNADCVFGSTYFYRNSSGVTGAWSFDFNLTSSLNFFFIGVGKVSGHALFPKQGYNLVIRPSQKSFTLDYISSSISTLDSYTSDKSLVGWMHVDITRDEAGEIIVYLNGDSIIETIQADLTSSEHINIQLTKDSQLDNLIYSNTADLPSEKSDEEESPVMIIYVSSSYVILIFLRRVKK